jgi:hypothetical protein
MVAMRVEVKRRPGGLVTINVKMGDALVVGTSFTDDGFINTGTRGISFECEETGSADAGEQRCREWLRALGNACLEASRTSIPLPEPANEGGQ